MPPKRSKKEEAMDFLSNLDALDTPQDIPPVPPASVTDLSGTPRVSVDSTRSKIDLSTPAELPTSGQVPVAQDQEAINALAFLEAQIAHKRAPLSAPKPNSRPLTPTTIAASTTGEFSNAGPSATLEPPNVPTSPAVAGGWGVSSFWSAATSAVQNAQKMADEQYKKVRIEGVTGMTGQLEGLQVGGVDLGKLRKQAEERLKGMDLDKLRHDLLNNTTSALTSILNTVAPPISAHETLELWLTHPMVGYAGVEGVVYRAWLRILEQTESGELVVVWSPPEGEKGQERGLYPVEGWDKAKEESEKEIEAVKVREEKDPRGRSKKQNPNLPVTTIPIFLHLQPLFANLPIPEPPIPTNTPSAEPPKHLYFLLSLLDPIHGLRFTTVSQAVPSDWLEVEYESSDWVEERLVDVIRTGVEVLAQDYVATRMGLKPS
ncbi:hypothetical protein TREMEDRAFT_15245, partial [Tremella mesenterica DSM 1558]|uniref:uncharacterized protein n=1 Tax=Tremella mesenterica (strain ATCC 24925 / CBS 8224 / DSM 1558 / NBRC 9311 / NRRL Y-6157 / RJB 2259-6 / UBC 559-6) TaxID=578456 RepID=UPI0003F48D15